MLRSLCITSAVVRSFTTVSASAMSSWPLSEWARQAIADANAEFDGKPNIVDPWTNNNTLNQLSICIARKFLTRASPKFLESPISNDDDRLVKVGRSLEDLVDRAKESTVADSEDKLSHGLQNMVEQCDVLASGYLKVPKVRYGKTELQISRVSLGCMRFQQTWGQKINDIEKIKPKVQANLVAILKYAICNLGINHIETARGYGSSELQMGAALRQLIDDNLVKREDLIIQSKVGPMDPKAFRATVEKSLSLLQVDYVDLFSFHGLNMDYHYDLIFNNPNGENLIDIAREYQAKGIFRHIGFSSHGQPSLICRCIETEQFEYANIHYHALGSYTASGGGPCGGNRDTVRLMKEKDMGVFIISPFDKGGRLYAPSEKLRSLTLPDMEPIRYGSLFLLNHEDIDDESAPVHTIVCGAGRPSDLDEVSVSAYLNEKKKGEMVGKVRNIKKRLHKAQVEAFGEDWLNSCYVGVPNCVTDDDPYQFGQMVWLYNIVQAFGMVDFAKDRYSTFDGNTKRWDFDKTAKENIGKMRGGWGYMPGLAFEPGKDYSKYLSAVPDKNKAKVLEALKFVHEFCSASGSKQGDDIPSDWKTAYDMRPWTEFPRQN